MPFGSLMMEPFQENLHNRANTYSEQCWVSLKSLQTATEKGTPHPVLKLVSVHRSSEQNGSVTLLPILPLLNSYQNTLCSSHQLRKVGKVLKVLYDLVTRWLLTRIPQRHYFWIPSDCFSRSPQDGELTWATFSSLFSSITLGCGSGKAVALISNLSDEVSSCFEIR